MVVDVVTVCAVVCVVTGEVMSCSTLTTSTLCLAAGAGVCVMSFVTCISTVDVGPCSSIVSMETMVVVAGGCVVAEAVTV